MIALPRRGDTSTLGVRSIEALSWQGWAVGLLGSPSVDGEEVVAHDRCGARTGAGRAVRVGSVAGPWRDGRGLPGDGSVAGPAGRGEVVRGGAGSVGSAPQHGRGPHVGPVVGAGAGHRV